MRGQGRCCQRLSTRLRCWADPKSSIRSTHALTVLLATHSQRHPLLSVSSLTSSPQETHGYRFVHHVPPTPSAFSNICHQSAVSSLLIPVMSFCIFLPRPPTAFTYHPVGQPSTIEVQAQGDPAQPERQPNPASMGTTHPAPMMIMLGPSPTAMGHALALMAVSTVRIVDRSGRCGDTERGAWTTSALAVLAAGASGMRSDLRPHLHVSALDTCLPVSNLQSPISTESIRYAPPA